MTLTAENDLRIDTSKIKILIERYLLFCILMSLFILSLTFSPLHINGDQVTYTRAYSAVTGLNYLDALKRYREINSTFEPVHFTVIWVASNMGLQKNLFMSILNVILAFVGYKYLRLKEFRFGFAALILLSNYYFYVMYFTLEKLKMAFILFLLFMILRENSKNGKRAVACLVISLATHFQMLILVFVGVAADRFQKGKKWVKLRRTSNYFFYYLLIILLGIGLLFLLNKLASAKIVYYFLNSRNQGLSAILFSLIVGFVTFMCTDQKKKVVVYFALLSIFILLLGSDRLNMFVYFGFIYLVNPKKNLSKVAIGGASIYFMVKSIDYLSRVYYLGG